MSGGIGESIRRRQRRPRTPRSGGRLRWGRLAIMVVVGAGVAFGAGYLLAVLVLFPAPPASAPGIVVPRLIGVDTSFAARTLASRGLVLGAVTSIPEPAAAPGQIVAQDALAGQQLRRGARVNVAISSGPARVVLPDVTGYAVARAMALLTALGFTVQEQTVTADAPAGHVVQVSPELGLAYDLPTQVMLSVSTGPPPDSTAADSTAVEDSVDIGVPPPGGGP